MHDSICDKPSYLSSQTQLEFAASITATPRLFTHLMSCLHMSQMHPAGVSAAVPGSEHDGVDADRATHHQEAKRCRHPEQAVH